MVASRDRKICWTTVAAAVHPQSHFGHCVGHSETVLETVADCNRFQFRMAIDSSDVCSHGVTRDGHPRCRSRIHRANTGRHRRRLDGIDVHGRRASIDRTMVRPCVVEGTLADLAVGGAFHRVVEEAVGREGREGAVLAVEACS